MKYRATYNTGGHCDFEVFDKINIQIADSEAIKIGKEKAKEKQGRSLKYLSRLKETIYGFMPDVKIYNIEVKK